jgi:hypothetical protein
VKLEASEAEVARKHCLLKAIANFKRDVVGSNGRMIIRKGKSKKLREKRSPVLLRPPQTLHEFTLV